MLDMIALILAIVGGLNWGLIGLFQFDLVAWIFGGQDALLSRVIYTLVGVAAIWCISLFFRSMEELKLCSDALRRLGGLHVAEPLPFNLEIFREDAGKGTALLSLAEHLGIDIRDTIGVGDSGNDITLLQTANLGLAVANATDSLKAVCDEIICANTEDAIDYIAKRYF